MISDFLQILQKLRSVQSFSNSRCTRAIQEALPSAEAPRAKHGKNFSQLSKRFSLLRVLRSTSDKRYKDGQRCTKLYKEEHLTVSYLIQGRWLPQSLSLASVERHWTTQGYIKIGRIGQDCCCRLKITLKKQSQTTDHVSFVSDVIWPESSCSRKPASWRNRRHNGNRDWKVLKCMGKGPWRKEIAWSLTNTSHLYAILCYIYAISMLSFTVAVSCLFSDRRWTAGHHQRSTSFLWRVRRVCCR
jgi:hypothetical protein